MKTKKMHISVIIPVYNAADFVAQAVESALEQPETAEVLLIEDGSLDESLAACLTLANKHEKVRVLRHPGGVNAGVSASRNLGMLHAQHKYIAFLDADDYYLPGRFRETMQVFETNQTCEGVYEAMGFHIENDAAIKRWQDASRGNTDIITMTEIVPPEALFERLVLFGSGSFHICGLVFMRTALSKSGFFNESLRLHEDVDFIWRLSAVAELRPGCLAQPVVIRRVHTGNTISAPRSEKAVYYDLIKMLRTTYYWLDKKGLNKQKRLVFESLLRYVGQNKPLLFKKIDQLPSVSGQPSFIGPLMRLLLLPFDDPRVIFIGQYWKALISIASQAVRRNLRRLGQRVGQSPEN